MPRRDPIQIQTAISDKDLEEILSRRDCMMVLGRRTRQQRADLPSVSEAVGAHDGATVTQAPGDCLCAQRLPSTTGAAPLDEGMDPTIGTSAEPSNTLGTEVQYAAPEPEEAAANAVVLSEFEAVSDICGAASTPKEREQDCKHERERRDSCPAVGSTALANRRCAGSAQRPGGECRRMRAALFACPLVPRPLSAGASDGKAGRRVMLLHSAFEHRPPVLFFPVHLPGSTDVGDRPFLEAGCVIEEAPKEVPRMYYCHTQETHEYNAVVNTLRNAGLQRSGLNSDKWSLCWNTVPKPEALRSFGPFQVTNHFPGSWHLGRKDLLWKSIRRMQRQCPAQSLEFTPVTFVLPEDLRSWEAAREANPTGLWIWKPANSSCGRGIRLLKSSLSPAVKEAVAQGKAGVVQRYLDRPLLIDGYKFDLRLYVVVTSFDPLKIYLNSEGLVRLATERYSTAPNKLHHRHIHLTNYSVNKRAAAYVKNLDVQPAQNAVDDKSLQDCEASSGDECEGADTAAGEDVESGREDGGQHDGGVQGGSQGPPSSKWSLQQLQTFFQAHGLDYSLVMDRVKDVIIKTVISAEPEIASLWHSGASFRGAGSVARGLRGLGPNQTCFEIFGFDIMIDRDLTPWLLEVNTAPSFSSSSPLDKRIKTNLVANALTLVGLRPYDYRAVAQQLIEERESQALGMHPRQTGCQKSHTNQSLLACSLRDLGEAEWTTILDVHDEWLRRGAFERIFPTADTGARYASLFAVDRYANLVLAKWLREGGDRVFNRAGFAAANNAGDGRGKRHPTPMSLAPSWVPRMISVAG